MLTWAIVAAAIVTFYTLRDAREYDDYSEWEEPIDQPLPTGEEIETSDGTITVYKSNDPEDPEAVRDVRYVSMNTGDVVHVADDPTSSIYQEKAVGKIGRIAMIKTGMRGERPVFDLVFTSFPELSRFTIARGVEALDTTQPLDDASFSAIVWDGPQTGRFIIVDASNGQIEMTRSLDFNKSGQTQTEAAVEDSQSVSQNLF